MSRILSQDSQLKKKKSYIHCFGGVTVFIIKSTHLALEMVFWGPQKVIATNLPNLNAPGLKSCVWLCLCQPYLSLMDI